MDTIKTKEMWVKEGIAHFNEQQDQEALQAFEQAIQIDPNYVRAVHGRGVILVQMKEYQKAQESFEQACKLAPDNAKIYLDLGELYYILEDYEKARIYYKKAVQLNSAYETIYFGKVDALLRRAYPFEYQRDYEEVIKIYKNILVFDPDASNVRSMLATLEINLNPELLQPETKQNFPSGYHSPICRCPLCMNY